MWGIFYSNIMNCQTITFLASSEGNTWGDTQHSQEKESLRQHTGAHDLIHCSHKLTTKSVLFSNRCLCRLQIFRVRVPMKIIKENKSKQGYLSHTDTIRSLWRICGCIWLSVYVNKVSDYKPDHWAMFHAHESLMDRLSRNTADVHDKR